MFKKLCLVFILFATTANGYAESDSYFPETLSIKQIKNCHGCVELLEDGHFFAKLEPDSSKKDVFYFLDKNNQKRLTLKYYSFEKIQVHDELYIKLYFKSFDNNNNLVAKLQFAFHTTGYAFLYFIIQTNDQISLIGNESLFGTYTPIYYQKTGSDHSIASLKKPLFTYSLDAKLQIDNKQELFYAINPYVFYATLAINSNADFFYSIDSYYSKKRITTLSRHDLFLSRKKIFDLAESLGMTLSRHPTDLDKQDIEIAKQFISQRYQEIYGEDFWNDENQDNKTKLTQLINLGYDLILSLNLSHKENYAMLQFLIAQLD